MKVYSDTLTTHDLYAALPEDVGIADIRPIRTRKRVHGWELHLEGYGGRHTRQRNTGRYGGYSDGYGMAATWDDHGVWMAALYEIDPHAAIAWYEDREDFYAKTAQEMKWRRRRRPDAPWLDSPRGRLEYLRGEIRGERISYGEIAELEGLAEMIDPGDVELLEWAGVAEFEEATA